MDPALSYGLTEFRRIVAMLFDSGWNPDRCVPHGGHQFNLSIASAFHLHGCESYPGIFEPFGGFADGYPILLIGQASLDAGHQQLVAHLAVRQRGLTPGRDVSIAGFDDLPDADFVGLTSLHQPIAEKGRLAGRLAMDPEYSERQIVLQIELKVRTSTGPAPLL